MTGRESRLGLGWAAVVCALLLGAAPAAAEPASVVESGTAATVSRSSGAPAPGAQPAASRRAHGVRRTGHRTASAPATGAPQAPLPAAPASGVTPLTNFNGVSSRDSALTNFGLEFEPPDQGLCVGNGFVVEMVNSAYSIYDTSGKRLQGPFNVNGPFNEGLTEFTSDPRCQYDAATNTWFATILSIGRGETEAFIDIAVNNSGDPTTPWTAYKVNVSDVGGATGPKHPGCPCLGDQPTLGIDNSNLYVTTNEFSLATEEFKGAQIYAFAKKDLVAQRPIVHYVHFDKLTSGGAAASSVQPAITTGNAPAEYFLNSIDPSLTFDQRVGVWAMTERGVVAKGGVPKLSTVVVGSEAFGPPPPAEQKGGLSTLDSGDDRMQQVQYINGSVWGELDTAITIPGESTQRAAAAWFQVQAPLSKGALAAAKVKHQGYVAVPANYVLYPALQITPSGAGAMMLTLTGPTRFPSAAYATYSAAESGFGPVTVAAAGTTSYDPEATRWGDYSWAILDPGGTSVWLATEYVPAKGSQTPDGKHDWGTRVLQVPTG
jgi:hypothetical protein